jgi:hypothetical protein
MWARQLFSRQFLRGNWYYRKFFCTTNSSYFVRRPMLVRSTSLSGAVLAVRTNLHVNSAEEFCLVSRRDLSPHEFRSPLFGIPWTAASLLRTFLPLLLALQHVLPHTIYTTTQWRPPVSLVSQSLLQTRMGTRYLSTRRWEPTSRVWRTGWR